MCHSLCAQVHPIQTQTTGSQWRVGGRTEAFKCIIEVTHTHTHRQKQVHTLEQQSSHRDEC